MNRGLANSTTSTGWSAWLGLSLLAGVSFWAVPLFDPALPLSWRIAWKGAGVALLAVHAALNGRDGAARWIAAVMLFGALGDMALEVSQTLGTAFFLVGHWLAAALYWRHRDPRPSPAGRAVAGVLVFGVTLLGANLPRDVAAAPTVGFYAFGLSVMAATALLSRFRPDRVALGALLFVLSDLLIFARMGPLMDSALPRLLIWPLYYAGQLLVTLGVLEGTRRAERKAAIVVRWSSRRWPS